MESSISDTIINDESEHSNYYQRSLSIDNSVIDDSLSSCSNCLEKNLMINSNDMTINKRDHRSVLYQQRSLPNGSMNLYHLTESMNRIDQSM